MIAARKPSRRRPLRPTTSGRAGGTRAWGKLSKEVAKGQMCWLRFPRCTIRATGADHYYPVSTHPHLEFVRSNLRPACHYCNTARRDTPPHRIPELRRTLEAKARAAAKPAKALGFFR